MSRERKDALWLVGLIIVVSATALYFDVFERFEHFAAHRKAWQIDELFVIVAVAGMGSLIYSMRRAADLRGAKETAEQLARTDALTGLPNRRGFDEELGRWLRGLDPDEDCAVFLIDLNGFKPVNDLYGHRLGDEVLRVISKRLKSTVADRGCVARMGGDEFAVILPIASDVDAAKRLASELLRQIEEPITLASLSIKVSASLGIALSSDKGASHTILAPQEGSRTDALIRKADMALYEAKSNKKGPYFFSRELDERLLRRIELERDMGVAIEAGEFVPHYQPIVDLKTGKVTACEMLARWQHPKLGAIEPSVFIPLAEHTGTIVALTFALLRHAAREAVAWPGSPALAINLSPRMLCSDWLAPELLRILAAAGLPAHRLELEITEAELITHPDQARAAISSLHNVGFRIALDDFGSGFAGIKYLRRFQVDILKFDKALVGEMEQGSRNFVLVSALANYCRYTGIQTIAEGIETPELESLVKSAGCDLAQGYLYGRPQPGIGLLEHLDERERMSLRRVG